MRSLFPEQLDTTLKQQPLPSILLVFGEELLLREDVRRQIRSHIAQQYGDQAVERYSYVQDSEFQWQTLNSSGQSMSLFGAFTLLELELPDNKPGREGSDALVDYAKQTAEQQLLVVFGDRLKKEQQNSRWFKALAEKGWVIKTPTPDRARLPRFIHQRASQHGLQLDNDAVELLSQWFEGNLPALDQELQKWALLHPAGKLSLADVQQQMQDVSQFSAFALQDSLLQGDIEQAIHRLHRLFEEDVDRHALFWVFQREVQVLSQLQIAQGSGVDPQSIFRQQMVWGSQQQQYQQRAQQLPSDAIQQSHRLLRRLEFALKDDSGEQPDVLFLHLLALICPSPEHQRVHQQLAPMAS